ncbi:MAG TPA: hypothetical protein VMZ74_13795 [Ramlibacter sp.]|nr:hypothetical protein [Ramlibacter sp.]
MLQRTAFAACLAASAAAFAQVPQPQDSQAADPRKNQKIERIHVEDNAVKIDETRYAGQTENVTVQPKDGMPAYEIVPSTPARPQVYDSRKGNTTGGERVWNVFSF